MSPRRYQLVPVIKAGRRLLPIPLIQGFQEENWVKDLTQRTTPGGREILRKILLRTEKLVRGQAQPLHDVVEMVQSEFEAFQSLQPEFANLLSKYWGRKCGCLGPSFDAQLSHFSGAANHARPKNGD
jgi:hypothetical protein